MPKQEDGMKICSKCGLEKPVECFAKNKANKDGLQYHCQQCISEHYNSKRDQSKAGKEKKPVHIKTTPSPEKCKITLDFSNHQGLFTKITDSAKADFRTPDMQIMAIVSKAIEGGFLE